MLQMPANFFHLKYSKDFRFFYETSLNLLWKFLTVKAKLIRMPKRIKKVRVRKDKQKSDSSSCRVALSEDLIKKEEGTNLKNHYFLFLMHQMIDVLPFFNQK
jgi:hypothetical protein